MPNHLWDRMNQQLVQPDAVGDIIGVMLYHAERVAGILHQLIQGVS